MLPNIFFSIYIAAGIYAIYKQLDEIKIIQSEYKWGKVIAKTYLVFLFIIPLLMNFSKADSRWNDLTLSYTKDAYAKTPDNALILLSGDIPLMTANYFKYDLLKNSDNRIIFTPGQFHLDWFNRQLHQRYPNLVIPPPYTGKMFTSTTQVIDANYGKWPIYVGPDLVIQDAELEQKYVLYPKHLLFLVKRKGEDLKLEDLRDENDQIWNSIDLNKMKKISKNTPMFDESIIFYYSRHFYNTGNMYEEVKLYDDAIREYKRVLEINPYFKEALGSLGRIFGYKLDPPDFATAVSYLRNYESVLKPGEGDLWQEAEGMISDLTQQANKEAEDQQKRQEAEQKAATQSAQPEQ